LRALENRGQAGEVTCKELGAMVSAFDFSPS
jgi:hypothetical protein